MTDKKKCAKMDSSEGVICEFASEFLSLGKLWSAHFFLAVKGDGLGIAQQLRFKVNSTALELSLGKAFFRLGYCAVFLLLFGLLLANELGFISFSHR